MRRAALAILFHRSFQLNVAFVHSRIGDGLVKLGDQAGTAASYLRALEIGEPAAIADPKDSRDRSTLMGTNKSLIGFSARSGQRAGVERNCAKALRMAGDLIALDPRNLATLSLKPSTLASCGDALSQLAKPGKATPEGANYYEQSVAAWQALSGSPGFGPEEKVEMERAAGRAKALR